MDRINVVAGFTCPKKGNNINNLKGVTFVTFYNGQLKVKN